MHQVRAFRLGFAKSTLEMIVAGLRADSDPVAARDVALQLATRALAAIDGEYDPVEEAA